MSTPSLIKAAETKNNPHIRILLGKLKDALRVNDELKKGLAAVSTAVQK